jgi:REP-associated tyrosine transposase
VIARGNERRDIFRDDYDRRLYLERLAECRKRYEFGLLAYCLMPNHIHLAIERGPVSIGKIVLGVHAFYGQKFNYRHERVGHLFQGRYKAYLVDCERYLYALVQYIHLNPVRGGLVDRPEKYPWSSDRHYRRGAGPEWLDVDFLLRRFASSRSGACAAYRRWMGSDEESYEAVEALARVVKGGEEFAERSMRMAKVVPPRRRRWAPSAFASAASAAQGFTLERLRGPSQRRSESRARLVAAYLGRRDYAIPAAALAACFRRDESAFAHGLRRFEDALSGDPNLARHVERISTTLETEVSIFQGRPHIESKPPKGSGSRREWEGSASQRVPSMRNL